MSGRVKKWALFAVRWGIAAAGIWYVVVNISWRDQVLVPGTGNVPIKVRLAEPWDDRAATVRLLDPVPGREQQVVALGELVNQADRDRVTLLTDEGPVERRLLALDLSDDLRAPRARRVLVENPLTHEGQWFDASRVVGGYDVRVPYPLVQAGLGHMLHQADPVFLWGAILIFPVTFLITGLRWYLLLRALDIHLGAARAFIINMVGAFYNTFMPGSTGGDLLKAYYAAKHTHLRTRAVMSVIIDRAIGLVALIILGAVMASLQWNEPACRQIAVISGVVLVLLVVALVVFYNPTLRRATGLDFVMRRLPMQRQVNKAIDAMEVYRRRPVLIAAALVGSFPVHMTVIASAMLAGFAFNLRLQPPDYWVIVPVIVLVGSIPISPQGVGPMEFFAILLTRPHGCTVAEAFALTMSIRVVQILWNLTGGIFVLHGGFRAPTARERAEQEAEESGTDSGPDSPRAAPAGASQTDASQDLVQGLPHP